MYWTPSLNPDLYKMTFCFFSKSSSPRNSSLRGGFTAWVERKPKQVWPCSPSWQHAPRGHSETMEETGKSQGRQVAAGVSKITITIIQICLLEAFYWNTSDVITEWDESVLGRHHAQVKGRRVGKIALCNVALRACQLPWTSTLYANTETGEGKTLRLNKTHTQTPPQRVMAVPMFGV